MNARALPALTTLSPLQRAVLNFLAPYQGGTLALYERHLGAWLQWCADSGVNPMDVDRLHVELFVRQRLERVKVSTVHTELTPVKGFYGLACYDDLIAKDPTARIRLPKVHRVRKLPVERGDLVKMLMVSRDISPRHWALIELLAIMALRISEAINLTTESFAEAEQGYRVLRFVGKGSKPATMPLPPPVLRALEAASAASPSDLLIPKLDGGLLSRHSAAGLINTVCRHAKITRHINPHLIRASSITQAFDCQIDPREVQGLARHDDLSTTSKHYDLGRINHDAHAVHILAARLAA